MKIQQELSFHQIIMNDVIFYKLIKEVFSKHNQSKTLLLVHLMTFKISWILSTLYRVDYTLSPLHLRYSLVFYIHIVEQRSLDRAGTYQSCIYISFSILQF